MSRSYRRQYLVDEKVQWALVLRTILYWFGCLLTVTMSLIVWRIFTGPARVFYKHFDDLWNQFAPALFASVLLLPLMIIDVLRFSNRFAGPVFRLRRSMLQAANGVPVAPIKFREDDFWRDFAEDFNKVVARLEALEKEDRRGKRLFLPAVEQSSPLPQFNSSST